MRLEVENNKETVLKNEQSKNKVSNKKSTKQSSNLNPIEEVKLKETIEVDGNHKSPKIIDENMELKSRDENDNSRRKRRRSSASIE